MDGGVTVNHLKIDGVNYKITSKRKPVKKSPSPEKQFSSKLKTNSELQTAEVEALRVLFKEKFRVENEKNGEYSIEFFIRGGQDATLQFTLPPEYPSDVPPTYTLTAPWMREKQRVDLYKDLTNIYSENFGLCIIYLWAEKIYESLKKENEELKNPEEEELLAVPQEVPKVPKEDNGPEIIEGPPIWDRSSCFSPYLAKITSEKEVKQVLDKIESCRKVSGAWRNTYAYRYSTEKGKVTEVGEDGGEPKAGRHLLQRLINYNALNVFVFISRRVGGRLLGADRFKHLNNAADSVLIAEGFKSVVPKEGKEQPQGAKKKEKKITGRKRK